METVEQTNINLREVCIDKEDAIFFLQREYLICCTECAIAMKNCPFAESKSTDLLVY